jgi:GDPmannose 4,6-dehydratase
MMKGRGERMPRAIIVGATGQDGTLLYQLLEEKKYQIFGIGRTKTITNTVAWNDIVHVDIGNFSQVLALVKKMQPDEVYHLAAIHHSSEDPVVDQVTLLEQSYRVNVHSLMNFLEAIRQVSPASRLFYAASSHLFGRPATVPQDEATPINPVSIYGITKASGLFLCREYRTTHKVFASVGILYNHESWLRGEQFVSRKIVEGAVRCKRDPAHRVILGDLSSVVDWGYAPDYVTAMHRILAIEEPDDLVVATGGRHTVKEFAHIAFDSVGLDWRDFVEEHKEIITRPKNPFIGNPAKLVEKTGWKASVDFPGMVRTLMKRAEEEHGR